jgi:hypothetical protein
MRTNLSKPELADFKNIKTPKQGETDHLSTLQIINQLLLQLITFGFCTTKISILQ